MARVPSVYAPVATLFALACSGGGTRTAPAAAGPGDGAPGSAADASLDESDAGLIFFGGDAAQTVPIGVTVPTTFVRGELGGYALGAGVTDLTQVGAGSSGIDGGASCDVLVGVVRDFKGINEPGGHPDFEAFSGKDVTPGLVGSLLGTDQKPVYASHCEAMPDKTLCPYGPPMAR
jgi:hypothetical protein